MTLEVAYDVIGGISTFTGGDFVFKAPQSLDEYIEIESTSEDDELSDKEEVSEKEDQDETVDLELTVEGEEESDQESDIIDEID